MTSTHPLKMTFGLMRAQGARYVFVFCKDDRCNHFSRVRADRWGDEMRLSDIEPKLTCSACGAKGSEIKPDIPRSPVVSAKATTE
jgi:hypothetical protein